MKGINFTDMDIKKLIVIQEVIDAKKTGKQAINPVSRSDPGDFFVALAPSFVV